MKKSDITAQRLCSRQRILTVMRKSFNLLRHGLQMKAYRLQDSRGPVGYADTIYEQVGLAFQRKTELLYLFHKWLIQFVVIHLFTSLAMKMN